MQREARNGTKVPLQRFVGPLPALAVNRGNNGSGYTAAIILGLGSLDGDSGALVQRGRDEQLSLHGRRQHRLVHRFSRMSSRVSRLLCAVSLAYHSNPTSRGAQHYRDGFALWIRLFP